MVRKRRPTCCRPAPPNTSLRSARWFWALDWGLPGLTLSADADEIRSHHRAAFSEGLGLGGALLVAEHLAGDALPPGIWNGGPMLLDVDDVYPSGERPDLIIHFGASPRPSTTSTYLIEAKGNSANRNQSIKQLRRGIDQVLALGGPELGIEVLGRRFMLTAGDFDAQIVAGVDRRIIAQLPEVESPVQLLELRAQVTPTVRTPTAEEPFGLQSTVQLTGLVLSLVVIQLAMGRFSPRTPARRRCPGACSLPSTTCLRPFPRSAAHRWNGSASCSRRQSKTPTTTGARSSRPGSQTSRESAPAPTSRRRRERWKGSRGSDAVGA